MARFVSIAVVIASAHANAAPCAISGDPVLVRSIDALLASRGGDCVPARVERRGGAIAVSRDDGSVLERVVDDAETAATVIESWGSRDVTEPLLAERPIARGDVVMAAAPAAPPPQIVRVEQPWPRGVQMFAIVETSVASDRTSWVGPELGACVMLGPVCAGARLRMAKVMSGPEGWNQQFERFESELLVGGDVTFKLGGVRVSPGFGGGSGEVGTHVEDPMHVQPRQYSKTGGVRADAHVALSYPIAGRLALDVAAAVNIPEATHVETNTMLTFPDEPWMFLRLGVGIRYGGW